MEKVEKARVTSKGQIVIPAGLRRKHGIKPGIRVAFIERGKEIIFQPITKEFIRSVCGMFKSKTSVLGELLKDRALDKEIEEKKFERLFGSR